MLDSTYQRIMALSQRLLDICEETNAQLQENRKKRIAWFVKNNLLDANSDSKTKSLAKNKHDSD